ncbi:ABC-2 type transport system ATP-binding protein [Prauserella shujinwangii]|uniref:ABC-2 type transport system ATP-binding protein n=1 Tax=Prauserella shujinwangii TaxID=1453103 RepID=A0A2T0LWC5_9PSEU|nr:ATP-binding cassette domain-containing protein [Prauserella shujinwangii]PRX48328.1 ABC-2 type transport system ATP-binding protein [Prauserella shujinwangii]
MTTDLAIEVAGLRKSFGELSVLSGVEFGVARGSVFALLGPNGSGKTTTVRILATLIRADAGHARIDGLDLVRDRHRVRRRISLTGQYAAIDGLQTGEENLRMMARLCGLRGGWARQRAAELLERFDLTGAGNRLVRTYSGGMRRRLDLAASLVGQPSVIFLDEPTTGLDVRSRQAMWEVVTSLTDSGVTVFLTTQYLEEADRLADRVAVLDGGRVLAEGTADELKERVAGQLLDLVTVDSAAFAAVTRALGDRAVALDRAALSVAVPTDGTAAHVRTLLDELDPGRQLLRRFSIRTATLDDAFIALTGHTATTPQPEKESARV